MAACTNCQVPFLLERCARLHCLTPALTFPYTCAYNALHISSFVCLFFSHPSSIARPQLRHSPPPPATHRHISQYSGYTARSPQPPPVHHQHNHQYQQQQHEGYHSGYHSGYSSDVGSDRDIAGSYGNRTYGGGGADADAAAAAAAAADSDGRYSNSGGRVAMGKKARKRRKRKPPPFTSYTSNGRASSTSPAAPFPSRSPSPAPLGQGLYEYVSLPVISLAGVLYWGFLAPLQNN